MGICLICTLGNRDIQFKEDKLDELNNILGENVIIEGKSDTDDLVINSKRNFLEFTKIIYDNYDLIKDYMIIPLIEPALNYIPNNKNIILISTNQSEVNVEEHYKKGDTFIEAKIIGKYLSEKGYNVSIKEAKFNASDLDDWFRFIEKVIVENDDFNKLIFEISGGVPTSKEAIRLASLFKRKIEVIEVANGKVNSKNMKFFEERIIKEKIKELIDRYNYTGVLEFSEYLSNDMLNIIKHLNYRLNFDFDNALNYYNEDRLRTLDNEKNTIKKLEYLILELLDNMEIELENGNYANFLARVYRLEEAMGQYFVLKYLNDNGYKIKYTYGNNGKFDKKPDEIDIKKNISINKILSYYFNRVLSNYEDYERELNYKLKLIIREKNKSSHRKNYRFESNLNTDNYAELIKKLCSKREIEIFNSVYKMYKKGRNNLRHTTIVAHGFEGIGEYELNRMLKENGELKYKNIEPYFKELRRDFYKLTKTDDKNIFDKINEEIVGKL